MVSQVENMMAFLDHDLFMLSKENGMKPVKLFKINRKVEKVNNNDI